MFFMNYKVLFAQLCTWMNFYFNKNVMVDVALSWLQTNGKGYVLMR
jgi:hypothetical protein